MNEAKSDEFTAKLEHIFLAK